MTLFMHEIKLFYTKKLKKSDLSWYYQKKHYLCTHKTKEESVK